MPAPTSLSNSSTKPKDVWWHCDWIWNAKTKTWDLELLKDVPAPAPKSANVGKTGPIKPNSSPTLLPSGPAKEFIRFGGQVVAIDNE